jgi:hypothetical protein
MIVGFLKHGAEEQLVSYSNDFNEHVGLSGSALRMLAVLRDEQGMRIGYMALYEGGISDAACWLAQSPFYQADLYERLDVHQCDIEIERPAQS